MAGTSLWRLRNFWKIKWRPAMPWSFFGYPPYDFSDAFPNSQISQTLLFSQLAQLRKHACRLTSSWQLLLFKLANSFGQVGQSGT